MKLALVVRRLSQHGGTERFCHGFTQFLVDRGHQVDVWCTAVDLAVPGAEVRPLAVWGRGRLLKAWTLDRAARAVPRSDYDVVVRFIRSPGADLYRAGGGCHAEWLRRDGRGAFGEAAELERDRLAVSTARCVVVNSNMAGDDLVRHYEVPRARLRLVRNGVDLQRFRPGDAAAARATLGLPPAPMALVGFVGTGFARKGLDVAIRAVAPLSGVHLVVAGADPSPGRYLRLARELGLGARFHLLGAIKNPELLLQAVDLAVLPTRYDPAANVTIEAMASGTPIVTSMANGAAEVLPEPWLAIARSDDWQGFSDALARALQTPTLGAACRAVAVERPASTAFAELADLALELTR
jgi:UDP-glucose:(heptosyl)LPS alpha-1,3-glucosyltransferase